MIKLYIFSILTAFVLMGCSSVNIIEPTPSEKGTLISLPQKMAGVETQFTVNKDIDGNIGGTLIFDGQYYSATGKLVTVHLDLTVPAGAFTGTQTVSLVLDDNFAIVDCSPSMVFAKPLILNFSYTGLDLKGVKMNSGRYGFYFIADDGSLEPVTCSNVVINRGLSILSVTDAQINHFSRYGWATLDGAAD